MKDGLREQHFEDNDAVFAAVRKWLASAGADFYESGYRLLSSLTKVFNEWWLLYGK
jgi:hypothetical protein